MKDILPKEKRLNQERARPDIYQLVHLIVRAPYSLQGWWQWGTGWREGLRGSLWERRKSKRDKAIEILEGLEKI